MNPTSDGYKVKLETFEGPMDLLLHLIKVNEMDIHEIRIAEITEQYLEYLKLMKELDLEVAGEFLVMAATLVSIKLRSLLPAQAEEEEETEEVDDIMTAQALMEKLVEYRKFKEASSKLAEQGVQQAQVFYREAPLPRADGPGQSPELQMDVEKLLSAFGRVLRFVEQRDWHLVTEEQYSVEEKIDELEQRLLLDSRIDVEELFRNCSSKVEMIVYLLAMLELAHLQRLTIEQAGPYSPIYVGLTPAQPPEEGKIEAVAEEEIEGPGEMAYSAEELAAEAAELAGETEGDLDALLAEAAGSARKSGLIEEGGEDGGVTTAAQEEEEKAEEEDSSRERAEDDGSGARVIDLNAET